MDHLDVERVRRAFPALADGRARFDSPGGSLTPTVVADAVGRIGEGGLQFGLLVGGQNDADAVRIHRCRPFPDRCMHLIARGLRAGNAKAMRPLPMCDPPA